MKTQEGKCKQERALKSSTCAAYVYEIQVDGVVRYIGKGRNGRVYSHLIDAKRTALRPGIKVKNLSPFFRRKLVEAVKSRSTIEEKIIASNLTDQEAYGVEQQMIGELHKNHAGQLWNTIDELFMNSQYVPAEWLSPVEPLHKVPRPLRETVDHSTGRELPLFFGQVPLARRYRPK